MKKNNSGNDGKTAFPEYSFVGTCLKVGVTIEDLKILTYVEIMKILVSLLPSEDEESNKGKASQQDIEDFLR